MPDIIKNDSDMVLPSRDSQSSGKDSPVDRRCQPHRVTAIMKEQDNVISQRTDTEILRVIYVVLGSVLGTSHKLTLLVLLSP